MRLNTMKLLSILILLSTMAFGQSGKSVLSESQKDSIGAMIRDSSGYVMPQRYGATGDGITDDSQAFINAKGQNLYIPEGVYNLSSFNDATFSDNWVGAGIDKTILIGDTTDSNIHLQVGDNFSIKNLTFKNWDTPIRIQNPLSEDISFELENVKFVHIVNQVMATDTGGAQDSTSFIDGWSIKGCIVDSSESGFYLYHRMKNGVVSGNIFRNLYHDNGECIGIFIGVPAPWNGTPASMPYDGDAKMAKNNIITGNTFENLRIGNATYDCHAMLGYGVDMIFSNNTINGIYAPVGNVDAEAIYFKGRRCIVDRNIIINGSPYGEGVIVFKNFTIAGDNVASNNVIKDTTSTILAGIYTQNNSTISGNVIRMSNCNVGGVGIKARSITGGTIINNDIVIDGIGIQIASTSEATYNLSGNSIISKDRCYLSYTSTLGAFADGDTSKALNISDLYVRSDSAGIFDLSNIRTVNFSNIPDMRYTQNYSVNNLGIFRVGIENVVLSNIIINIDSGDGSTSGFDFQDSIKTISVDNIQTHFRGDMPYLFFVRPTAGVLENAKFNNVDIYSYDSQKADLQYGIGIINDIGDITITNCDIYGDASDNMDYFLYALGDINSFVYKNNNTNDNINTAVRLGNEITDTCNTAIITNNTTTSPIFFTQTAVVNNLTIQDNAGYVSESERPIYETDKQLTVLANSVSVIPIQLFDKIIIIDSVGSSTKDSSFVWNLQKGTDWTGSLSDIFNSGVTTTTSTLSYNSSGFDAYKVTQNNLLFLNVTTRTGSIDEQLFIDIFYKETEYDSVSDFSNSLDGWDTASVVVSYEDSISDGAIIKNSVLKSYANNDSSTHYIEKTLGQAVGDRYIIQFDYYIPNSQTNVTRFGLGNGTVGAYINSGSLDGLVTGGWTTYYLDITFANSSDIRIYFGGAGGITFVGENSTVDDIIYFRNIVWKQI